MDFNPRHQADPTHRKADGQTASSISCAATGTLHRSTPTNQPASRRAHHGERRVYDNPSTPRPTGSRGVEAQATTAPHPQGESTDLPGIGADLDRWIAQILLHRVDAVVFTSPRGVRRVLEAAAARRLDFRLIKSLRETCLLTSNPETAAALNDLGLKSDVTANDMLGLVRNLRPGGLYERSVAVQFDEVPTLDEPDALISFFRWVRAEVKIIETPSVGRSGLIRRLLERVA